MTYIPDEKLVWLVQHYSATFIDQPYSYKQLERDHLKRGFSGVGYHYYIRLDGTVIPGRDLTQEGRFEQGAHSLGENDQSIGICCEGGLVPGDGQTGRDTRTPAQIAAQIALIDKLMKRYPNAIVIGHRDMPGAATQCPGYDAASWWASVLAERRAKAAREPDTFGAIIKAILAAIGVKLK